MSVTSSRETSRSPSNPCANASASAKTRRNSSPTTASRFISSFRAGAAPRRLRPLARDHTIEIDPSGLLTIAGGKWTTYRKMAEDCIDRAIALANLPPRPCITARLQIHGGDAEPLPLEAQVLHAARHEMARSVEDILARRTRTLFLDVEAAQHLAPSVAALLARELGHDPAWQTAQVRAFTELAQGYRAAKQLDA